ncbi:MAG: hypothetical protein J7L11_06855 [Thermoprotei archaeon]|nr:hypothetical protein [Thermoprotei archaeon]
MARIIVSTCREPGRRIRSFSKELAASLPDAIRVNRGKYPLGELARISLELGADTLIIVGSRKGNPGRLVIYRIEEDQYYKVPPLIRIRGVKLLREIDEKSPVSVVKSLVVTCSEGMPDEVKEFAESLAGALRLPYVEITSYDEVMNSADILLSLTHRREGHIILKFLNANDLKPAGPLIRVDARRFR